MIAKEQEREQADIARFQAREEREREREIAIINKTRELEQAEIEHLRVSAEKARADHEVGAVRVVADAERDRAVELIRAEREAGARKIAETTSAEVASMHVLSEADARKGAAERDSEAAVTRARATSEAQTISAAGIKEEAAARGRAEAEIESLRADNARRMLEAEASGIEAKAEALAKYNDAAMFLELAKLHIAAERDVHIDQAKAMGSALSGAQIRMFGGNDGTVDTIRGMFTSGFSMGRTAGGRRPEPAGRPARTLLGQRHSRHLGQARPAPASSSRWPVSLPPLCATTSAPRRTGTFRSARRWPCWRTPPRATTTTPARSAC